MDNRSIIKLAVILSVLSFSLGVMIGYSIYNHILNKVFEDTNQIDSLVTSAYLFSLSKNMTCEKEYEDFLRYLKEKIAIVGRKLTYLESPENVFYNKEGVEHIKSQYFNIQYLHFIMMNNYIKSCNVSNFTLILYFYNNDYCYEECNKQGGVLTTLYLRHYYDLYIYSFDSSYQNYFIQYYNEKYNITTWPYIILIKSDKEYLFKGFTDLETLEKYMTT